MSLPAPYLDNLRFQDIVDDAKRKIGLRCPEWTDHNVSDPGVTLIELFAYMTDAMTYRLNQVPERNYIKFLEMLGISLQPPTAARTELRFHLSRPVEDTPDGEANEFTLPAHTEAATIRTTSDEAVEFSTDAPLRFVRPRLSYVFALPASPIDGAAAGATRADTADFLPDGGRDLSATVIGAPSGTPWQAIYSPYPQTNDAVCFGFSGEVLGAVIELQFACNQNAATERDRNNPSQVWEAWNDTDNCWQPLPLLRDTTKGFSENGVVELALPTTQFAPRLLAGSKAYWVRARYTTNVAEIPLRPGETSATRKQPPTYQSPPEIGAVGARTVGGAVPASHAVPIFGEELGQSDSTPGQTFRLRHAPVLSRSPQERLLVGPQDAPLDSLEAWTEVSDFGESGPTDRHYTCDALTGEIRLGPVVVSPDGTTRSYGKTPEKGETLRFSRYRIGGGVQGNVLEGQVRILKSSIPYITEVTNPYRGVGGAERETLEHAKMRSRQLLRMRERAVTPEDFEELAMRIPGVGRARCVSASADDPASAGVVKILLIPTLPATLTAPLPSQLRVPPQLEDEVRAYLDERRLLTTVLRVEEPDYLFVSTEITLIASPQNDPEQVRRRVRERLEAYLHPLTGGPQNTGWPFGRMLTLADIYAQVQAAQGVAFLLGTPKLFLSGRSSRSDDTLNRENLVSLEGGVPLQPYQVLCTREHRVTVLPMDRTGQASGGVGSISPAGDR